MTASDTSILAFDSSDEFRPEPAPEPQAPAWRDGSVRIGIHTSIAHGFSGSLESASKLGCNALQIFSASPRMWPRIGSRILDSDAAAFRAKRAELGLGPLVIHANYLINLASSDPVMRVRSIQAFHDEMVRGVALSADYLVVHPGSCCGKTPGRGKTMAQALRDVAQAIRQAARGVRLCGKFGDLRDCRLRVLLENTSGMGMAIGSRFEELKAIMDGAPELPLGVCLDTAHAFHAGYDIRSEAGLAQTIAALDRTVGLTRVAVLHVNDSKTPFASRVDRHEHIGRGKIGLEAFRRILNHPRLSANSSGGCPGRAFLLETPIDAPGDDRRNVRRLWDLVGITVKQAPRAQNGFSMRRAKRSSRAPHAQPKATIRSGSSSRPAAKVTILREKATHRMRFSRPTKSSFRRLTKSRASGRPALLKRAKPSRKSARASKLS
jgi:deoxyribonuclease-4